MGPAYVFQILNLSKDAEQTHAHGREAVPDLPDVIVAVGGQELMMSEEDGADARAKVEPMFVLHCNSIYLTA